MLADGLTANLPPKALKLLTAFHLICLGLVMGTAAGVLASLRLMYTQGDNLDHLTADLVLLAMRDSWNSSKKRGDAD